LQLLSASASPRARVGRGVAGAGDLATRRSGVSQHCRRCGLIDPELDPSPRRRSAGGSTRPVWLAAGAVPGLALAILGVVVIAALDAFSWLSIRRDPLARGSSTKTGAPSRSN